MKTVLMIAFHYPPLQGSSGLKRTLAFARHLPKYGWRPVILTVRPNVYPFVDTATRLNDAPPGVLVYRAAALDTARHLAFRGRYAKLLALPDRWVSWTMPGTVSGLRIISDLQPSVIWSTYPIATAHLIGLMLHRVSRIPWVADFRDSMTEQGYPPDPRQRAVYRWIERQCVKHCARAVFTAPGAVEMYARRYSEIPASRWTLIRNGYDEDDFRKLTGRTSKAGREDGKLRFVHSGKLYRLERDPAAFFAALGELRQDRFITSGDTRIVLRASGDEDHHRALIAQFGIGDIVSLEPAIPYTEALKEVVDADGLLLFQAATCNHQIPAKLYEYLRAQRPVLALTDPAGDTAVTLRECGIGTMARLDSTTEIKSAFKDFVRQARAGHSSTLSAEMARRYSREYQAGQLTELLEHLVGAGPD